jgi:hypothetical protein
MAHSGAEQEVAHSGARQWRIPARSRKWRIPARGNGAFRRGAGSGAFRRGGIVARSGASVHSEVGNGSRRNGIAARRRLPAGV